MSRAAAGPWALLALALAGGCGPGQRWADLGDLPLEGGGVLRDCRVGYRTLGQLDATRSNAVLVLPWFLGTSGQAARHVRPGRLVDPRRYYVIVVDPLADGVSSSPSNSRAQPGDDFPRVRMADAVESQRRLLVEHLGLRRLHAVVGISMGGMQAFTWATAHPGFAERVVAVAGTPRFPAEDAAGWRAQAAAWRALPGWRRVTGALGRGDPWGALEALRVDPIDRERQTELLLSTDVARGLGGSLDRAAQAARGSRLLVVVSPTDEAVRPGPAVAFARAAGAELVELDGRCGHAATRCDAPHLWREVERFLAAP